MTFFNGNLSAVFDNFEYIVACLFPKLFGGMLFIA